MEIQLFKDITLLFSQAEVPLIVDALPMLNNLQESLLAVVDDTPTAVDDNDEGDDSDDDLSARPTPAVIRIAAYASVQLIDKYLDHLWDCEIYVIAISKLTNFYNSDSPLT